MKLAAYIYVILFTLAAGYFIGQEVTYTMANSQAQEIIRQDRDYYSHIIAAGTDEPMTQDEAISTLEWLQWTHQNWLDHPEWLDYNETELENERRIIRTYGRLINFIRR